MIRALFLAAYVLALSACAQPTLTEGIGVNLFEYRIGTGDRLKVQIFGEERLSGEFVVRSDGKIAYPLTGDVNAGDKTLPEFRNELRTRVGEFLRNPQVAVEMLNFRPVYVLGEVAKPGEFAFTERMSVFALVAKAGGFSYRANQAFVFIRHEKETEEKAVRLSSATAVQPGDTIRVPERTF